jgi:hypothetical protein
MEALNYLNLRTVTSTVYGDGGRVHSESGIAIDQRVMQPLMRWTQHSYHCRLRLRE